MKTTPGTEDVKSSPHELQRKLSNRHLQLIAIGGCIGTGLAVLYRPGCTVPCCTVPAWLYCTGHGCTDTGCTDTGHGCTDTGCTDTDHACTGLGHACTGLGHAITGPVTAQSRRTGKSRRSEL